MVRKIKQCSLYIIIICMVYMVGCSDEKNKDIYILSDESFFNEFTIKNGKVVFNCYITIINNTENDVKFKIKGDFIEDAKVKNEVSLVKQRYIYAQNEKGEEILELKANQTKQFILDFYGDFAGKRSKRNRLLPDLELERIRDDEK